MLINIQIQDASPKETAILLSALHAIDAINGREIQEPETVPPAAVDLARAYGAGEKKLDELAAKSGAKRGRKAKKEEPKQEEPKKEEPKQEEPKKEAPKQEEQPAPPPETAKDEPTIETLRSVVLEVSQKVSAKAAVETMKKICGVGKASEVPAENYAEVIAELRAALDAAS